MYHQHKQDRRSPSLSVLRFGVICYISHLILNSKFNKLTKQEAPETEENETPEITEDDIEVDTLSEEDEEEIKEIVYRHK